MEKNYNIKKYEEDYESLLMFFFTKIRQIILENMGDDKSNSRLMEKLKTVLNDTQKKTNNLKENLSKYKQELEQMLHNKGY